MVEVSGVIMDKLSIDIDGTTVRSKLVYIKAYQALTRASISRKSWEEMIQFILSWADIGQCEFELGSNIQTCYWPHEDYSKMGWRAEMWRKFDTKFYGPVDTTWITLIKFYRSNPLPSRKKYYAEIIHD